jgi:hypothetical protein
MRNVLSKNLKKNNMKLKKNLIIYLTMTSSIIYSQTDIIAYKSHSGTKTKHKIISDDNFGGPQFSHGFLIDTIRRLNDSIVLTIGKYGIDSLCHHPYLNDTNVSIETLQNLYEPRIKFVGFEKNNKIIEKQKPTKNDFNWLLGLILTLSFTSSVFVKRKKGI